MTGTRAPRPLLALLALLLGGCVSEEASFRRASALTGGGDPAAGRALIRRTGCGSCHTVPGVVGARSLVGPPLTGMAQRVYIAGVLENTPVNMIRWLQDPQSVDSLTAMPDVGLSEEQARDVAAYLYTLR